MTRSGWSCGDDDVGSNHAIVACARRGRRAGRPATLGRAGVLLLPPVMVGADLAVVYLCAPQLAGGLAPSSVQQLWVLDLHAFLLAGLLLPAGVVGDRLGRKRLLLGGAATFAAASGLAAWSPSVTVLIAARAVSSAPPRRPRCPARSRWPAASSPPTRAGAAWRSGWS